MTTPTDGKSEPPPHFKFSWLLLPLMCYGFMKGRSFLNQLLLGLPAWVEVTTYLALALFFYALVRMELFANSAQAFIEVVSKGLLRLGVAKWRVEMFCKLASPLASITQSCLLFLSLNMLVNTIPDHTTFTVPRLLAFVDSNGDGLLQAEEIESSFFFVASRILFGWMAFQGALYIQHVKEPPTSEVGPNVRGPVGRFLNGLQRLAGNGGKPKDVKYATSQEALIIRTVDKSVGVATWFCMFLVWAKLADLNVSTILAVGGVGGLAVSLASKNIMQNLISGGLIFLHQAVVEGDEIQSADGKIAGVVSKIRATNTVIDRLEGDPLIVPNTMLVDNAMINLKRRDFWLIERSYPVMLESFEKLPEVLTKMQEVLDKMVKPHMAAKKIVKGGIYQTPLVYFDGYGHQGANVKVRAYVDGSMQRHDFYKLRSGILLALSDAALSTHGVGFGFEAHHISGSGGGHGGH